MIAIKDIAYVRYGASDLDEMERFLLDFGLRRTLRTDTALYMRAASQAPFVHVTELGKDAAQGVGFWAQSLEDLYKLGEESRTPVEDNTEPGGGKVVRLTDADGLRVDVLYGQKPVEPQVTRAAVVCNFNGARTRGNAPPVLQRGPSVVTRFGHVVIRVKNVAASHKLYMGLLGMRIGDSYHYPDDPERLAMSFLRCGLGKTFTDHHTVALIEQPRPGLDHMGFEVLDFDSLLSGKEHLHKQGHRHAWGVGRHNLGSQIFDYWRDPTGLKLEHWTDGDAVNDDYLGSHIPMGRPGDEELSAWGPLLPPEFFA